MGNYKPGMIGTVTHLSVNEGEYPITGGVEIEVKFNAPNELKKDLTGASKVLRRTLEPEAKLTIYEAGFDFLMYLLGATNTSDAGLVHDEITDKAEGETPKIHLDHVPVVIHLVRERPTTGDGRIMRKVDENPAEGEYCVQSAESGVDLVFNVADKDINFNVIYDYAGTTGLMTSSISPRALTPFFSLRAAFLHETDRYNPYDTYMFMNLKKCTIKGDLAAISSKAKEGAGQIGIDLLIENETDGDVEFYGSV